ncbi:MAG: hypothetical protein CVU52_05455 [Deltaproteobacteria bacterium HGW-Deltaproteobacteria-10]|nr:MAG: hypothetical protein CVU52_05455 [Deltaproteobacteria bacterium HGW-Deltaproteobacteria-10]
MINFPGRRHINILLPRKIKEDLFRLYNFVISKYPKRETYPKYFSLNLTTRCNLRCTICDRTDFQTSDMDFNNLVKLKNPIKHAKMVDLTGWGEAILYKKYADVVAYIFSLNNRRKLISQTSNGVMVDKYAELVKGRLQRFVISLNAASLETYNREMKGGDFNKTISNIQSFMSKITSEDRKCVRLHFVTHLNNYGEMPLFVELANSLNITQVSFGQYMCSSIDAEKNTLLNIKTEYNHILKKVDEASKKFKVEVFYRRFGENLGLSSDNCRFPFDWCFIYPDGEITPCCYLADITMGNVFDNTFESIWFGEKIQKLRKSRYLPSCSFCAPFQSFDNPHCHFAAKYNLKKQIDGKI